MAIDAKPAIFALLDFGTPSARVVEFEGFDYCPITRPVPMVASYPPAIIRDGGTVLRVDPRRLWCEHTELSLDGTFSVTIKLPPDESSLLPTLIL